MSLIEEYLSQFSKRWVSLNFTTTTERTYSFIDRDFVVPTCFNTLFVATYSEFYELEYFLRDFFVLNLGKQKGCNSFCWSDKSLVYVSAEGSGSNKRQISFS